MIEKKRQAKRVNTISASKLGFHKVRFEMNST